MPTVLEFLAANTQLPVTGTYTVKQHFDSIRFTTVTAELGGEIVITPIVTDIIITQSSTNIPISVSPNAIEIDTTPTNILVSSNKPVDIVITPDC